MYTDFSFLHKLSIKISKSYIRILVHPNSIEWHRSADKSFRFFFPFEYYLFPFLRLLCAYRSLCHILFIHMGYRQNPAKAPFS